MKRTCATVLVVLAVALTACKKEDDPAAPVITYRAVSSTSVTNFQNELTITFDYEDFQGDIGEEDPDTYSLRIKDDRLAEHDWYHIPPMTPELQELHIRGSYVVHLEPLFLLGSGGAETTRFTLQVRDREGNWSNAIMTPVITINP